MDLHMRNFVLDAKVLIMWRSRIRNVKFWDTGHAQDAQSQDT